MRAQFICHREYAELAQPGKTSWDLVERGTTVLPPHCAGYL
jgi:hypothetical protein